MEACTPSLCQIADIWGYKLWDIVIVKLLIIALRGLMSLTKGRHVASWWSKRYRYMCCECHASYGPIIITKIWFNFQILAIHTVQFINLILHLCINSNCTALQCKLVKIYLIYLLLHNMMYILINILLLLVIFQDIGLLD